MAFLTGMVEGVYKDDEDKVLPYGTPAVDTYKFVDSEYVGWRTSETLNDQCYKETCVSNDSWTAVSHTVCCWKSLPDKVSNCYL